MAGRGKGGESKPLRVAGDRKANPSRKTSRVGIHGEKGASKQN